jgi:hypothetical protein
MTISLEAAPTRSASLTTTQLESVRRVWHMAGLPPASGYAATFLAVAVVSNQTLAATLITVDFDDADVVANAVEELLRWRHQAFRATS